ncbi:MAG: hypothetical protein SNJ78_00785 [Spirochaetales bacterium]
MGDERKINGPGDLEPELDLVEKSKSIFLQELATEFRQRQAQYNLEVEFAKTKQNRSLLVPVVVAGIILLFLIGAVAVTLYIEKRSREVQVDSAAFEAVNLREVLDAAKRNEQELANAKKDLESIKASQESELEQARLAFQRQSDITLASTELSQEEKNRRLQTARITLNRQIEAIQTKYVPLLTAKEKEIQDIQKRIDEYDTRMVERAREQEAILNNQRKLFDLEMQQTLKRHEEELQALNTRYTKEIEGLKKYQQELVSVLRANHAREIAALILKYNPKQVSERVAPLLQTTIDPAIVEARLPQFNSSLLTGEGLVDPVVLSRLPQKLNELQLLLGELKKIPFENVVPSLISQMEARQKEIGLLYEQIIEGLNRGIVAKNRTIRGLEERIQGLNREIAQKNALIGQYSYAFEQLLNQDREQGFVIDARDPKNILVVVDRLRAISPGSRARVFRRDNEYIGKIQFTQEGNRWAVLELQDAQNPIRPFDKILIEEQ